MMAGRAFDFEALAEVTNTDWTAGRGELNAALKSIRQQEPDIHDSYLLSVEIHDRAKLYREVMGEGIILTPSALAKHWRRVVEQAPKPVRMPNMPEQGEHRVVCETCDGLKLVLVGTRASKNPTSGYEEMAPCPDCNSGADVGFWRVDGSRFRCPSPEIVRARMRA